MKKSAVVTSIILVAFIAIAWIAQFSNVANQNKQYKINVKQAQEFVEKGLYQKAMETYEVALSFKENKQTRTAWMEAGIAAYKDGVISAKDLGKAITKACEMYPEEVVFWEKLLMHYLETSNYTNAYEAYMDCKKTKATSDTLTELGNTIVYSYTVSRKGYADFTRSSNGYFTVCDERGWGVIDSTGERIVDCNYTYISPYNKNEEAVFVSEKGVRLINADGVVESILTDNISLAAAYSDGLLPVCENGSWRYLDCYTGKKVFDTYDMASSFTDGIAAVSSNGKWTLIDTNNKQVCKTVFDDIKIHSNGAYVCDDIMIASVNGQYGIYDAKGKSVAKFTAKDMDAYYGGDIAYQDGSGKWGFVNKDGDVSIKPVFDQAKSFSGSLAAVCSGEKWGYVDQKGSVVIDYQFIDASYFSDEGSTMVSSQEGTYVVLKRRFK